MAANYAEIGRVSKLETDDEAVLTSTHNLCF